MDFNNVLFNYVVAVTFGDPIFIGAIMLLAIVGFIMWKLRINVTAGIFIITALVYGMSILVGGIWTYIVRGLAIIVFISVFYAIIKLLNR